jgi:L-iditol 2-dehydrogenase
MRAAELIAPQTFRLTEMEIEDPGPGEVQVRVEAVGVCGSDLHAYIEGAVGGRANVYPMLLGHEPAGRIVKAGAGVTGLAAGDRGALEPALYCYHCEFCLSGHHNVCANIRFLSNPGHPGFFRELVNLPVTNFLPIPGTMSYGEAALAEPLAIALHSLRLASIGPGESVAVIGAGPIGLLTIAALKAKQAGRIWAWNGWRTAASWRAELALTWCSSPAKQSRRFSARRGSVAWIAQLTVRPEKEPPARPLRSRAMPAA